MTRWPVCPKAGHFKIIDTRTGELLPGQCGALKCYACVAPTALKYARALALTEPQYELRLSLIGNDRVTILANIKAFHRRLRCQLSAVNHAYSIEVNPQGTGHHIHGWTWGAHLDATLVQDAAVAAGMGLEVYVGLPKLTSSRPPMIKYGMKAVLSPPPDATEMWPEAREFLSLNGGKVISSTRGYWRDPRTGILLPSARAANAVARQRHGLGGRYRAASAA